MIFLFSIALCNWLITCLIQTLSCIASAKLQILKAIHNAICDRIKVPASCIASAKLQILKAIHNNVTLATLDSVVVLRVQSYKF